MGLPDFAHLQSHELNGKECISHSNVTGENRQRDDALLESNDKVPLSRRSSSAREVYYVDWSCYTCIL